MTSPRRLHGLTLVELLVGLAIGLLIAANGLNVVAANLRDSRSLLLESRLMQDLRTAADVITRDVRRAGYWAAAENGIAAPGASAVQANPYLAFAPAGAVSDAISFRFSRDVVENGSVDPNEQFGFRLRGGAIEMQLGSSNWQALTDSTTLVVTAFVVTPSVQQIDLSDSCSSACATGSTTCPPLLTVRSVAVQITGHALADAAVARTLRSSVRLRTDAVVGACTT